MLNYADGMLFGWQFWLAAVVTIGAFWYIMRYSRKHAGAKPPHAPKSFAAKSSAAQRPQSARPPTGRRS